MFWIILIFIIIVLIIGAIITFLVFNSLETVEYPEYYKDVEITFKFSGENSYRTASAWLAVNDHGDFIWTLSDTDIVIDDENVISWQPLTN